MIQSKFSSGTLLLSLLAASCAPPSNGAMPATARIVGGFPLDPDHRIAHAFQVRVADSALRSVETAAPEILAGLLRDGISVPRTEQQVHQAFLTCTVVACPQGCRIPIQLATTTQRPIELGFVSPDQVRAIVRIAIPSTSIPIQGCSMSVNFTVDTSRGARSFVGLSTMASVRPDVHRERQAYDAIQIEDFDEAQGEEIENDDFECRGGGMSRVVCAAVNTFLRDSIRERIRAQFGRAVEPLRAVLNEPSSPNPPGCPTGTQAVGSACNFPNGTAVPLLLGIDGTSVADAPSVGAIRTSVNYLLAAGDPYGPVESSTSGMTLNGLGGALATAHSPCVPTVTVPPIPTIPEWTALRQNQVPGSGATADIGVGISEDFLNVALFASWNAGLLCRERDVVATTQLAASFASAIPPNSPLRALLFPSGSSSLSLAIHPLRPPRVTVAREPLLRIDVQRLTIDLLDSAPGNATPIATVTTDLSLPLSATVNETELRPVPGNAVVRNTSVSGPLVTPEQSAALLALFEANVVPSLVRYAATLMPIALPRIALPGAGTIQIVPVPGAIQGIAEGTSRYLGVWANVRYHGANPRQ